MRRSIVWAVAALLAIVAVGALAAPARHPHVAAAADPGDSATTEGPDSDGADPSFEPPIPMSAYLLGVLRRGPAWTPAHTPRGDSIQAGHLANLQRMYEAGVLIAAGPFRRGGDLQGLFVFPAESAAKVMPLVERDPALHAQMLKLDLETWYANAGIGDLYRARQRAGKPDSMVTYMVGLAKLGPRFSKEMTPETMKIQERHIARVFELITSGRAAAAGPLEGKHGLAGVFVMRGDSAEAARTFAQDPNVMAGRLVVEIHPWMTAWGAFPGDTL